MKVPDGWRVATLGEVATWGSGGTPKRGNSDYYGGPIPWAVIGDLCDGPVRTTVSSITELGLKESSAKRIPAGALLIAMYGSIGKLGLTTHEIATNQAIAFALPCDELDLSYFFYYMLAQRKNLDREGKGATQRNISQTLLKAWPIALPPLPEQRRIVERIEELFAHLDAAEAGLEKAERRLEQLKASAFDEFFSSSDMTGTLGELTSSISAGKSFGASAAPAHNGEWGIIKVSAMTSGVFRPEENKAVDADRVNESYEIRSGDILLSRANTSEYVGASVLVRETPSRLLLSDKSLRLTPAPGIDATWLWSALQAPSARQQMRELATGTKDSMRNISQPSLRQVRLPRVSSERQSASVQRMAPILEQHRRMIASIGQQRQRSAALRRSILAAAFEGGWCE